MLNFVIDQVLAVITEVKHKLLLKAIDKFSLLNRHMRPDTDGAPAGPAGADEAAGGPGGADAENEEEEPKKLVIDEEQYIKEYPECPMAFDQMIITIS